MKVTVLELPARWGAVAQALDEVERELSTSPPGDLVLLPEASLTGYLPDPSPLADTATGATAQRCSELARRFGTVVVAPLIERDADRVFNALVAYAPDGVLFHYRKRHPWYVETWATPGDALYPLVQLAGADVAACICFDVHFLGEAAGQLEQADVLLFASAWVDEADEDARLTLLPAVAQRFGCAVVNANWGVGVPRVKGQGGSLVVGRDGAVLARCAGAVSRLDVQL